MFSRIKNWLLHGHVNVDLNQNLNQSQNQNQDQQNRRRDARRFRRYRDNLDPTITNGSELLNTTNENNYGNLTSDSGSVNTLESSHSPQDPDPFRNTNRILGENCCDWGSFPIRDGLLAPSAPFESSSDNGTELPPYPAIVDNEERENQQEINNTALPRRKLFPVTRTAPTLQKTPHPLRQRILQRVRNRLALQSPSRGVTVRNEERQVSSRGPIQPVESEARTERVAVENNTVVDQTNILENMAYQRPLVPVRLEMPKYSIPLSRVNVKAFIERWQAWATTQALPENMAKLYFALSFTNANAQNYFNIIANNAQVTNMQWNDYVNYFLAHCPFEDEDPRSVLQILNTKQPLLEKASLFIQRLRAQIHEEYGKYQEPDLVRLMIKTLQPPLVNYLYCKGPPETYSDLLRLIKYYEDSGLQVMGISAEALPKRNEGEQTKAISIWQEPKLENQVLPINQMSCEKDKSSDLIADAAAKLANALMPMLRKNARDDDRKPKNQDPIKDQNREQPRERRPEDKNCMYCGKPGHKIENCFKLDDEKARQQGRQNRGNRFNERGRNFRGNGRPNSDENPRVVNRANQLKPWYDQQNGQLPSNNFEQQEYEPQQGGWQNNRRHLN